MANFQPKTLNDLLALAGGIASAQIRLGMMPEAADRLALIDALIFALGLAPPPIISGYRSHEEQRQLHDIGRPTARTSWHTRGLAYDLVTTSPTFDIFAALWKMLGGRDGRDFQSPDPGHFDFPVPGMEPDPSY